MHLPRLGPRGEGWVLAQLAVGVTVAVLGARHLRHQPSTTALRGGGVALGATLMALGVSVIGRGVRDLGPSLTPMPRPRDDARLVEDGIYGMIRHPIYAGVIALCFGWAILTGSPAALVASAVEALIFGGKARVEEEWLGVRYPEYAAYALRTHRFIPGVL